MKNPFKAGEGKPTVWKFPKESRGTALEKPLKREFGKAPKVPRKGERLGGEKSNKPWRHIHATGDQHEKSKVTAAHSSRLDCHNRSQDQSYLRDIGDQHR